MELERVAQWWNFTVFFQLGDVASMTLAGEVEFKTKLSRFFYKFTENHEQLRQSED